MNWEEYDKKYRIKAENGTMIEVEPIEVGTEFRSRKETRIYIRLHDYSHNAWVSLEKSVALEVAEAIIKFCKDKE